MYEHLGAVGCGDEAESSPTVVELDGAGPALRSWLGDGCPGPLLCGRRGERAGELAVVAEVSLQRADAGVAVNWHEGNDGARVARATSTSGSVEVAIGVRREVEVHNTWHIIDVNAAGYDVGGHEGSELPAGELIQGFGPLELGSVAVNRLHSNAERSQLAGDTVGPALCPAEHEGLAVLRDHLGGDAHSLGGLGAPEVMDNVCVAGRVRGHLAAFWITLIAAADGGHLWPERRREKEELTPRCCLIHEAAHRLYEAHVNHPVGLIEYHRANLGQAEVAPRDEILEPTRTSHDNLHTPAQIA